MRRLHRITLTDFRRHEHTDIDLDAMDAVAITGSNGAGKCLPGDSLVFDADRGTQVSIREFVANRRRTTIGLHDGKIRRVPVVDWISAGRKQVVEVEAENGEIHRLAATHPVLTDIGCVNAGVLTPGKHWIAEARRLPAGAQPDRMSCEEAEILGMLLGDGYIKTKPILACANADVAARFKLLIEKAFPGATSKRWQARRKSYPVVNEDRDAAAQRCMARLEQEGVPIRDYWAKPGKLQAPGWESLDEIEHDFGIDLFEERCGLFASRTVERWLAAMNLAGCDSFTKRVPPELLLLPEPQIIALLTGLWMTDGTVNGYRNNRTVEQAESPGTIVSYTSASLRLAQDVRTLLLRLGIVSTISTRNRDKSNGPSAVDFGNLYYTVIVTAAGARKLLAKMPLYSRKGDNAAEILGGTAGLSRWPNKDVLPPSIASTAPRYGSVRYANNSATCGMSRAKFLELGGDPRTSEQEVVWWRVKNVRFVGTEECFDITVDTPEHLYLADKLVVHNSSVLAGLSFALHGPERGTDPIRTHQPKTTVVVEVTGIDGERYRITRSRSRKGQPALALDVLRGDDWQAVGERTVALTQDRIRHMVLGMDQAMWEASSFAGQRRAGALLDLAPGARKELLGQLLGLERFEGWREAAAGRWREADGEVTAARAQLEQLATLACELEAEAVQVDRRRGEVEHETAAEAKARAEIDRAREARHVVAQVAERGDLLRRADNLDARVARLVERTEALAADRDRLAEIPADLDERVAQRAQAVAAHAAWEREDMRLTADLASVRSRNTLAQNRLDASERTLAKVRADLVESRDRMELTAAAVVPRDDCPTCGQEVFGDAAERVAADLKARADAAHEEWVQAGYVVDVEYKGVQVETRTVAEAKDALRDVEHQVDAHRDAKLPEPSDDDLDELVALRATLQGRVDAGQPEDPQPLREEANALRARASELPDTAPDVRPVDECERDRARAADRLAAAHRTLAACETAAARLAEIEPQRVDLQATIDRATENRDALAIVGTAFSRRGIPALLIDQAAGALEVRAAQVLDDLGSPLRLRITTQRTTQKGTAAETLDVLVDDGVTERPIESCSGGEQYRCFVALRLALADVATGGRAGLLVLDEPTDLDAEGVRALADMLARLGAQGRQVLLVTHQGDLCAAMPHRIHIEAGQVVNERAPAAA